MPEGPIGAVLAGKYEVRALLGRGGMGGVYEGVHLGIDKRVAIKLLEGHHAKDGEIAERFRREGRVASRVESDHVVQVFDVGEDETWGVYLVMEFLVGEDLHARLKRDGRLQPAAAIEIARQAARGLAKAHAAGVIHRDLKPANVFLAQKDDGTTIVKLVDFGIARIANEEVRAATHTPETRSGATLGTPQYMSPEQAQGQPVDARSDVWSLGVVLYEMLAGKPAYEQLDNYEQTIFAIVRSTPPPLDDAAPDVPRDLVRLVERAMEHDLDRRIGDAATFARLLDELGGEVAPGSLDAPLTLSRRSGTSTREPISGPKSSDPPPSSGKSSRRLELADESAETLVDLTHAPKAAVVVVSRGLGETAPAITAAPISEPPPSRRSPGPSVFGVIALLAIFGAAAAYWMHDDGTRPASPPAVAAPAASSIPEHRVPRLRHPRGMPAGHAKSTASPTASASASSAPSASATSPSASSSVVAPAASAPSAPAASE